MPTAAACSRPLRLTAASQLVLQALQEASFR
jgi:hypothetical protein